MRSRTHSCLAVAALGAFACGDGSNVPEGAIGSDTTDTAAHEMLSPAGGAVELSEPILTAGFQAMEADTADEVTGTLRIFPDTAAAVDAPSPGFRLEVVLDGLTPGGHAWHIHSGACGEDAPVVVPFTRTAERQGIAHPLDADHGETARALVTVPRSQLSLDQLRHGRYSVHVHQRPGIDHGPTVACADLSG